MDQHQPSDQILPSATVENQPMIIAATLWSEILEQFYGIENAEIGYRLANGENNSGFHIH